MIEVPYVALLKEQFPSYNVNLSLLRRVILARVLHFGKIWDIRKRVVRKKGKIVDRASLSSALESRSSKLQYEPCLFSVAYS